MDLLPLNFYSLSQAVDFINQKTGSMIKENLLYSYAIEEKIKFLIKIKIKNNELIKIGRNDVEGFFIDKDSELFFKEKSLKNETDGILRLEDSFSTLEIEKIDGFEKEPDEFGDLYISYDKNKIRNFSGYVVLYSELLDLFVSSSMPDHSLSNTNYIELEGFTIYSITNSDIYNSLYFTMKYPGYNEYNQLIKERTFRINLKDIKISYDDLINLIPSDKSLKCNDLEQEIKKLKSELEEKQKIIDSLSLTNQSGRISSPQKQLFALLVKKCYPKLDSRNKLFDVINADLKESGIRNTNIAVDTFYKLIDESNDIIKAIFPPKKS